MSEKKISGDEIGSGKFIFTGMKLNKKPFDSFSQPSRLPVIIQCLSHGLDPLHHLHLKLSMLALFIFFIRFLGATHRICSSWFAPCGFHHFFLVLALFSNFPFRLSYYLTFSFCSGTILDPSFCVNLSGCHRLTC